VTETLLGRETGAELPAVAMPAALAAPMLMAALFTGARSEIAARGTLPTGPGFIDDEIASVDVGAVERFDRSLSFFSRAHSDKAKSARAARHFVHDEHGFSDGAKAGKKFFECSFGRLEGEITYIELHDVAI
jgi:hypothetical protein